MPPEAVERAIVVRCSPATAFQVFTAQLDRWWPRSHSRSGDPAAAIALEPWPGGRLYERTPAGAEYDWGRVIAWDPPRHLAYHWYLGSGAEQPSRVDVRFVDLGDGQTRVEVTHRGPELLGELWARNSAIYAAGWAAVLPPFAALCADG